MIDAQYAVSLLKGQLAKIEVAINMLLSDVKRIRSLEEAEQNRIQKSEPQVEQIMKESAGLR